MDDRPTPLNAYSHQVALLRGELNRVWAIVDSIKREVDVWRKKAEELAKERDDERQRNASLEAELKDVKRQLAVHENYNNPSSKAILFAKKRKAYRNIIRDARERGDANGTLPDMPAIPDTTKNSKNDMVECVPECARYSKDQPYGHGSKGCGTARVVRSSKKRGAQFGSKGISIEYKLDKSLTKVRTAKQCALCGRGVVLTYPIPKQIIDLKECEEVIHYTEICIPGYCQVCDVISYPATDAIAGTAAGPRLRRIIVNLHMEIPSISSIMNILQSNHNTTVSQGFISNCLSAVVRHAREGGLWEETCTHERARICT